jgi:hypothetical protein
MTLVFEGHDFSACIGAQRLANEAYQNDVTPISFVIASFESVCIAWTRRSLRISLPHKQIMAAKDPADPFGWHGHFL